MVSKRLCVHSDFVFPASLTFSRSHRLHPRGSSFSPPSFLLCPLDNGDCPLWLSWPPGWSPPNPPPPSSRGILGACHSHLALNCLKPLGGLLEALSREAHTSSRISLSSSMSPQPSAHKSHQSQHCPSDGHSPHSVFSHTSPLCSKPSFSLGSSLIPLPPPLDSGTPSLSSLGTASWHTHRGMAFMGLP